MKRPAGGRGSSQIMAARWSSTHRSRQARHGVASMKNGGSGSSGDWSCCGSWGGGVEEVQIPLPFGSPFTVRTQQLIRGDQHDRHVIHRVAGQSSTLQSPRYVRLPLSRIIPDKVSFVGCEHRTSLYGQRKPLVLQVALPGTESNSPISQIFWGCSFEHGNCSRRWIVLRQRVYSGEQSLSCLLRLDCLSRASLSIIWMFLFLHLTVLLAPCSSQKETPCYP